ncbi:PAM68 family protein [Oscillatoria sp. CS-180]|uniref:PAM68 family protein n=1 Tax=Oscillatoria sp. CS-180 TaxID=3021720 RepID=UPI00232E4004|nr:PAM68 family protein [Oscillatoria sp. CS-180]MDB9526843.1 PAM68 family protein [Oscillatoria sp. CS-180]
MPADSENDRLPFEPNRKRKKAPKSSAAPDANEPSRPSREVSKEERVSSSQRSYTREETSIPEVVGRRMLRRMMFFSGIPVTFGILTFFVSYVLIVQGIAELPNVVVLLVTLACFGLSVVGLSYGALSASWEENTVGTLLGLDEFRLNFGRLLGSWRQAREERRDSA